MFFLVVGGVLASAPAWARVWVADDVALVVMPLSGVAIGAPAFLGLCLFARCTRCGYRLFWHAVAKRTHSDSIGWFVRAVECPACGYSHGYPGRL